MVAASELRLGVVFTARMDRSLRQAVSKLKGGLAGVVGGTGRLGRSSQKASKGVKNLSGTTNILNKQIGRAKNTVDRLQNALKVTTAYTIMGSAVFGLIAAVRIGITEIGAYDQALRNLEAISGATTEELRQMDDVMRDVANTTKFSTTEIAQGMVYLAQSGLSAAESINSIQQVANLASGTLTDLATTSDLFTTTLRAFNLDATQSARIADVMANAVTKSKLTIDKLKIAFNFVGAAASQANLSIEETAATMMVLANNGLRASTIGTGFRQVLAKLIAPSNKLRETFSEYGVELEKINPLTAGYEESIKNLSVVLWDAENQTIDMAKAFNLFKLRGAQAAAIIAKSFISGDFNKALLNAYRVGTAAEMLAIQSRGLAFKFKNMADKAKLLALELGDAGLTGVLRGLVDLFRKLFSSLTWFVSTPAGNAIVWAVSMATALLALKGVMMILLGTTALKGLIVGIALLIVQFQSAIAWSGVLAGTLEVLGVTMLLNPWTALAAAIGAVVGAWVLFNRSATAQEDKLQRLIDKGQELTSVLSVYGATLEQLKKRKEDGKNIDEAFHATITRLIKDVPELKNNINQATASLDEWIAALKKFNRAEETKTVEKMTDKIVRLQEKINELTLAEVEHGKATGFYYARLRYLNEEKLIPIREAQEEALQDLVVAYTEIVSSGKKTHASAVQEVSDILNVIEGYKKLTDVFDKDLKKAVEAQIKRQKLWNKTFAEQIASTIKALPEEVKASLDQVDDLRRLDLLKSWIKINKEIAQESKGLKAMGRLTEANEEALIKKRDKLYKEELSALHDKTDKLEDIETEALKRRLAVQASFHTTIANMAIRSLQSDLKERKRYLLTEEMPEEVLAVKRFEMELETSRKILDLEDDLARKRLATKREIFEKEIKDVRDRGGVEGEVNRKITELTSEFTKYVLGEYDKRSSRHQSLIDSIIDREENLTETIRSIKERIKDIKKEEYDYLRELSQEGMSTQKKAEDDYTEAIKIQSRFRKAVRDGEIADQVRYANNMKSLFKEVIEGYKTDRIKYDEKEGKFKAKSKAFKDEAKKMNQALKGIKEANKFMLDQEEEGLTEVQTQLKEIGSLQDILNDKMRIWKQAILDANKTKLTLDATEAINTINRLNNMMGSSFGINIAQGEVNPTAGFLGDIVTTDRGGAPAIATSGYKLPPTQTTSPSFTVGSVDLDKETNRNVVVMDFGKMGSFEAVVTSREMTAAEQVKKNLQRQGATQAGNIGQ